MRERCPHCGTRIGLRGPRTERLPSHWNLHMQLRHFCRTCGIRLEHVRSPLEQASAVTGWLGLLLCTAGSLARQTGADVSVTALFIGNLVAVAAFAMLITFSFTRQHYVVSGKQDDQKHRNTPGV